MITVLTSVTNIATTLIAIAAVDRAGRRPLLIIGSIGMAVALGAMSFIFGTAPVVDGVPQLGAMGPVALAYRKGVGFRLGSTARDVDRAA